ncbi:hypothetical protein [Nocardia brasiliensis]|uniref:hypothetical protein n=1 Tax=Nocardia brasiliensis TaxID=37326 RepID=UPI002453CCA6|nr:hypothetical protein [Nocardia brasiliensis]
MTEPGSQQWQILFPEGLTADQVARLAEFAASNGIEQAAHGVDDRAVLRYDFDRATVELYRHLFQKILDGAELTANNRLVLADRLAELDAWAETATATD